jgi:hypothetical protein
MIESYSFGTIKIDGKTYTSDIILYPDRVDDNWWRKSGHLLQKEDIKDIIKFQPDVLVVGTGASGLMEVPSEIKEFVESKGIDIIVEKTKDACKTFNKLKDKKRVVGAFHLTC